MPRLVHDGARLDPYAPHPILAWIYQRFFEHIEVDEAWAGRVRDADARGTVVYVLRNLSFVDFLALDHLTKRLALPQVRFANDLGLAFFEPLGGGWLGALRGRGERGDERTLRRTLDRGASAALFLKRPKGLLEAAPAVRQRGGAARALPSRGKSEGDALLRAVLEAQRARATPILLVPQVFVWTRHPDEQKQTLVDAVFGPREWPGATRTVVQFLTNYRHVTLRAGEPLDVRAFLAQQPDGIADDVLVRRLTYALLRRLERERRAVIGPTKKPLDRLREQVVRSPRLQKVIRDMAGEGDSERHVLATRARAMVGEMEAEMNPTALRALDALFDQTVARMYSGFEIDEEGLARVRRAAKDGTLVLLPSHKSHVDYILLTKLFLQANLPPPLVAAGDNLAFFPLGPVLRRAGAFFIRRSFKGDRLYGAVVDAYMRRILKDGWPLEFFLEGGRSRTGKLLPPKVGLLSIVVDAALAARGEPGRAVVFCPISIGYERIVEERAYVREVTGGEKQREDVRGLLGAAETALGRYGRLNVQFGDLLTVDDVLRDLAARRAPRAAGAERRRTPWEHPGAALTPAQRRAVVTRLAYRVMNEINRVTAVTPSALVAAALLAHEKRGIPHAELVLSCERLGFVLAREGARFTPSLAAQRSPFTLRRDAVSEACELFQRAGHLEVHVPGVPVYEPAKRRVAAPDAVYVVPDLGRLSLDIAKNLIVHFFVSRAMIATPLAAKSGKGGLTAAALAERAQALSRLFKYEFQFRADAPFETIFAETLAAMRKDGEVIVGDDERLRLAAEGEAHERARLGPLMIRSYVESYRVAARALSVLLRGPLSPRDLAKRAVTVGERMFLGAEISRREAATRPLVENAFLAFVDQGYLARTDGKYALPESYADPDALATITAKIAAFL